MDESKDRLVPPKPAHVTQYLATLCGTFGAMSSGIIMGYSSPSSAMLQPPVNGTNCPLIAGEALSDFQLASYSSVLSIGAMLGVVAGGFGINYIGRRGTMVATIIPSVLSWVLTGFAVNFAMLMAGRLFGGVTCGIVSISVPTYIGEIASPDIRGRLGSGFQLLITVGILYSYAFGSFLCWQWLVLPCGIPALVFGVAMVFNKESPTYLLANQKYPKAKRTLKYFRGQDYNVEPELKKLEEAVQYARENKASLKDLGKPHIRKPLFISLSLVVFQQFSGVNALFFNLDSIFQSADVKMSADESSITVASVQVVVTLGAAMLMDKAGRKMLLILSSAVMTVSMTMMGTYFYLEDEKKADDLNWMPLTAALLFVVAFSIGFGPIPWVIMGEVFSADVRELAVGLAAVTVWLCSFIVTCSFTPLQDAIPSYVVYWIFAGMCAAGFFFSVFFVKETKGKTTDEITMMFGGLPTKEENVNPSTAVVSIS